MSGIDIPESVVEATEMAIAAATHLTAMDAGAISTLMQLAEQVDYLVTHNGLNQSDKFDNVSIPTYLKYCTELGLTPAGREKLATKKQKPGGALQGLKAGLGVV